MPIKKKEDSGKKSGNVPAGSSKANKKSMLHLGVLAFVLFGAALLINAYLDRSGGDDMKLGMYFDESVFKDHIAALPLSSSGDLPGSFNLEEFAPSPGFQGMQSSCVGWASTYGCLSTALRYGVGGEVVLSPAWTFDQIRINDDCFVGSYMGDAMKLLKEIGAVEYEDYPYNPNSCNVWNRDEGLVEKADGFRIKGWNRLSANSSFFDHNTIRKKISNGFPVMFGSYVGGSFFKFRGKGVWEPTDEDREMVGWGGHAMAIVGYNNEIGGGSYRIMNSWGPFWGDGGFAWVRYSDVEFFGLGAVGFYMDRELKSDVDVEEVQEMVDFGVSVVSSKSGESYRLWKEKAFRTLGVSVPKGEDFKLLIDNEYPAHCYIFGQGEVGVYNLFPDKEYDAYFPEAGERLFPDGHSLYQEGDYLKGMKYDEFLLVVSKDGINVNEVVDGLNGIRRRRLADKARKWFKADAVKRARVKVEGNKARYEGRLGDDDLLVVSFRVR